MVKPVVLVVEDEPQAPEERNTRPRHRSHLRHPQVLGQELGDMSRLEHHRIIACRAAPDPEATVVDRPQRS